MPASPSPALVMKPVEVTFEQAAAVPVAALTALQGLRDKGKIQPGQKALINGAAGGVGTFAVQIARWFGAEVTAVCSTRNVDLVRSIGADHVVDYAQQDVTRNGQHYDLIFDCVGNHPLSACTRLLKPRGIWVMVGDRTGRGMISLTARLLVAFVLPFFVNRKLVTFLAKPKKEDLTIMCDLMKAGKVTPIIDRLYSLSEVAEAIRYLGQGHARGKVVISFQPGGGVKSLEGSSNLSGKKVSG